MRPVICWKQHSASITVCFGYWVGWGLQGQFHGRTEIAPDQKQKFLQRLQQVHQNQQGHGTGAALLSAGGSSQIPHLAAPMPKQSLGSQQQPAFLQQVSINIRCFSPMCLQVDCSSRILKIPKYECPSCIENLFEARWARLSNCPSITALVSEGIHEPCDFTYFYPVFLQVGKTVSQSSSCSAKEGVEMMIGV